MHSYVFYDIHNFSLVFLIFLVYVVHLQVFCKLLQISRKLPNIFVEKHLYVSGPTHFKPMLFKGQL